MSIKIRKMNMPPKGLDTKRLDKDAREGVAIAALPGGKEINREDNEMTH